MIRLNRIRRHKDSGFTLIELVSVMFILAVLITIMIPNVRRALYNARLVSCQNNLRNIANSVDMYMTDNEAYPTHLHHLTPDYLKMIPTCPEVSVDTYTEGYEFSVTPSAYTLRCEGSNHTPLGLGVNEPWYSPDRGIGP